MVCDWSPEPPRDEEDRMSMPSVNIAAETDESEDETFGHAPPEYELLPQALQVGAESEEEEQSDAEEDGASDVRSNAVDESSTSDEAVSRRRSEVEESDRLYSVPDLRPELTVDCDQVRAAMSGFSLPPSAIPAWARDIPESQWAATLTQQIRRIQGNRDS